MENTTKLELKYRPKSLREFIGNKDEIKILESLLKSNEFPKLVMLNGSPGSGKTSIGYVLSLLLLCKNNTLVYESCGKCDSCNAIKDQLYNYGRALPEFGIYLFDMGLKSDLEYVQNIANNILSGTFNGRKKVLLIDELQMVNLHNQDPLLKATEFIPDGVTVIITTSEPYKISKSLRNRIDLTLTFNPPSKVELVNYGKVICEKEFIKFNRNELTIIADYTKNNVRQFLKLLDTAKKNKNEILSLLYGESEKRNLEYIKYFEVTKMDMFSLIEFIEEIENIEEFVNGLKYFIKDYIKMSFSSKGFNREYRKKVMELFQGYSTSMLFKIIDILLLPIDKTINGYELILLKIAYELNNSYKIESKLEDKLYKEEIIESNELDMTELKPTDFVGSDVIKIGELIDL